MATFNYHLKDSKSEKETQVILYIRWAGLRLRHYPNEKINPIFWDNSEKRSTKYYSGYKEFNSRLDNIENKVKDLFRRFQNDNEDKLPTKSEFNEIIKEHFEKNKKKKNTLFSFYQNHIDTAKSKYSLKTIQWYQRSLEVLKEFQKDYDIVIDFETIDLNFYDEFIDFLTFDKEFKQNTIGKHIQNLKAVLNSATERGFNTNMKYKSKSFKKPSENSQQIYLTESEIEALYKLDLNNNPRLDRVRDLFIVGSFTGLRYGDLSKLTKDNIRNGFINVDVNKTNTEGLVIPIHPYVKSIMQKYNSNESSLPKPISGNKMNKYIREVGALIPELDVIVLSSFMKSGQKVKMKKKKYDLIGTHTARRSFATNMYYEDNGIDTLTIMAITNHKTEKAFLTYIKTTRKEHAIKIEEHWNEKYRELKIVS